jgi:8-oxo-dGTP pyrophosphatase MutT (NUDIX family)
MLRLIPPPLHRQLYRVAYHARKRWLRLSRAEVHGCTVIGRDAAGRFLLVRHSYGPDVWAFPGGGMRPNEDPLAAALREFAEELGCTLADPSFVGHQQDRYLGTVNHVRVFTGLVEGDPLPDRREIVEARFFAVDQFPARISSTVRARLALIDVTTG